MGYLRDALGSGGNPWIVIETSRLERLDKVKIADPESTQLREIGVGSFGIAYECPGSSIVFKKTLQSFAKLQWEFDIAQDMRIAAGYATALLERPNGDGPQMPRIPKYHQLIGESGMAKDPWWGRNGRRFPTELGGSKPGPVMVMEHIPPLPKEIRTSLINVFFPPEKRQEALADPDNKDCMIRPYLAGRLSDQTPRVQSMSRDTLRNFPLFSDELRAVGINTVQIAMDIAAALATAHWHAHIDMKDVEFVIASRPGRHGFEENEVSFKGRAVQLWMFDWDKVDQFTWRVSEDDRVMRESAARLVNNTLANGQYYPSPIARCQDDFRSWNAFQRTYIDVSRKIIRGQFEAVIGFWETDDGKPILNTELDLLLRCPRLFISEWVLRARREAEDERPGDWQELRSLWKTRNVS